MHSFKTSVKENFLTCYIIWKTKDFDGFLKKTLICYNSMFQVLMLQLSNFLLQQIEDDLN